MNSTTTNDCIAITFGGAIHLGLTPDEARGYQRRSGGCIRSMNESPEDLRNAYRETYSTFHTPEEVEAQMTLYVEWERERVS
jgi:hypothetical protein